MSHMSWPKLKVYDSQVKSSGLDIMPLHLHQVYNLWITSIWGLNDPFMGVTYQIFCIERRTL